MPGFKEKPPHTREELPLNEEIRPFESETVQRALKGNNKKDVQGIHRDGKEVTRDIHRIARRLSGEKGREVGAWQEVMERVKSFESYFTEELTHLIAQLEEHPVGNDSRIDEAQLEHLVKALRATKQHASVAFEHRRFHAPNHTRPLQKRYFSVQSQTLVPGDPEGQAHTRPKKLPSFLITKPPIHLVSKGLVLAHQNHHYTFENVQDPTPEEVARHMEERPNVPPDYLIRDSSRETLNNLQKRLAEFMRVRDHLSEDRSRGFELTSVRTIERMKREYDLVQEAIERLEKFEKDVEALTRVSDYDQSVGRLPEFVADKLDKKISRGWTYKESDDGTQTFKIPNEKKIISDKERKKILEETEDMWARLHTLAEGYRAVIDACKDLKI